MVYIGNVNRIPVGEAAKFTYPMRAQKGSDRPWLLIHLEDGFVAYDRLCTHMQAKIEWNRYT